MAPIAEISQIHRYWLQNPAGHPEFLVSEHFFYLFNKAQNFCSFKCAVKSVGSLTVGHLI